MPSTKKSPRLAATRGGVVTQTFSLESAGHEGRGSYCDVPKNPASYWNKRRGVMLQRRRLGGKKRAALARFELARLKARSALPRRHSSRLPVS